MAHLNQVNIDIDVEAEGSNRNALHRMDSVSRPLTLNRNHIGLGDRLNSVFREIRPLVEHARMGNNARLSLPTWLPRNPPGTHQATEAQRPQSSIAHVNLGSTAQTYIVTERNTPNPQRRSSHGMTNSASNDSNVAEQAQEHMEINASVNPSNNNNIHENADSDSQSEDATQQSVDLRATLNLLLRYAPFYLILFIKSVYDGREGIFTFIILLCTFHHSNNIVTRENGKQMNRSILLLSRELIFSTSCVLIVHYLCGDGKLLPNVVMLLSYIGLTDVWELIWLVVLTDLIVKIFTVNIKILITIMPACIVPYPKRGKLYLFTEAISQFYRALVTIQPWIFFLMQSYDGGEAPVGMLLISIYIISKLIDLLFKVRLLRHASRTLMQSVDLGTKPTSEQLVSAGYTCPICHDEYTTPVRLGCSHIFCELCIAAWLDREDTCPLCRAKVADEPIWRDGSTTYDFQLY